jgi:aminoglycoside phosphotransferase (APT) family kinase protein
VKTGALRRADAYAVPSAPAATPPEEIHHTLKGHSGASVVLHTTPSHSYVRKTAGDPSSNARLLAQAAKQRDLGRSGIPFPRIFVSGLSETGHAFFDMAYVPGRTVADAVANAAALDVHAVLSSVGKMLWLFRSCCSEAIPGDQFRLKIESIERAACASSGTDPALSDAIHECSARLYGLDWRGIPESPAHGDLTLENIMVAADRRTVFIDCDQPWISSYWLDFGKLFQDCYGHWFLRSLYRSTDTTVQLPNAIEKLEKLTSEFRALAEDDEPGISERLPQLAALNLFRALPYAGEPRTASFICERVSRVLDM